MSRRDKIILFLSALFVLLVDFYPQCRLSAGNFWTPLLFAGTSILGCYLINRLFSKIIRLIRQRKFITKEKLYSPLTILTAFTYIAFHSQG